MRFRKPQLIARPTRIGGVTTNPFRVWDANEPVFGEVGSFASLAAGEARDEPQKDVVTEETVTKVRFPKRNAPNTNIGNVPWTFSPQSSWVHAYRYHYLTRTLQIIFKNKKKRVTACCQYSNIQKNLGYSIYRAKSKGKWVWRNVYYLYYTRIF